jgi:hypothetical protein
VESQEVVKGRRTGHFLPGDANELTRMSSGHWVPRSVWYATMGSQARTGMRRQRHRREEFFLLMELHRHTLAGCAAHSSRCVSN